MSVSFKNTFGGDGYQGINTTWRDPSTGHSFEVQLHTPESFAAKGAPDVSLPDGAATGARGGVYAPEPVGEYGGAESIVDALSGALDATTDLKTLELLGVEIISLSDVPREVAPTLLNEEPLYRRG